MPRKKPIEVFTPPNVLKVKLGAGPGTIDTALLSRAESALSALREEFAVWLDDQAKALSAARDRLWRENRSTPALADVLRWSVEIKGQGATMSFPFVTRVASSLVTLLQGCETREKDFPRDLVDAHVDAICAAVRDSVTDPNDPVATALATQLEANVAATLKA